jgi:hypothetical protein
MSGQPAMRVSGTKFGPLLCLIRVHQNGLPQKLNGRVKNLAEQS